MWWNNSRKIQFQYVAYDSNKLGTYVCKYIVLSERAYKSILAETFAHGESETGGILLGHFVNGVWYIIECIDPGLVAKHSSVTFEYDENYVNHQKEVISRLYNYPLTILGIWHRHPGSMDSFSPTDLSSIDIHVSRARAGILSMLVNVDPSLRMTFYYCGKDNTLMKVPYDVGDDLIIKDIILLADDGKIQENTGARRIVNTLHQNKLPARSMPLHVHQDPIPAIREALSLKYAPVPYSNNNPHQFGVEIPPGSHFQ